jgi:hypothetical protein
VERHLDQRADPGRQALVELVGERAIEREHRTVDADVDGSRKDPFVR